MRFTGFFGKIEGAFQHLFGKSANATHLALAAITYAAPIVEGILAVTDPAAASLVDPIITRVESGLAVAYSLSTEGSASSATLASTLAAVKADLGQIESVAGIKDAATQASIQRVIGQIQAVIALIPGTAAVPTA